MTENKQELPKALTHYWLKVILNAIVSIAIGVGALCYTYAYQKANHFGPVLVLFFVALIANHGYLAFISYFKKNYEGKKIWFLPLIIVTVLILVLLVLIYAVTQSGQQ